jgi:hypothetical protein
MPNEKDEVRLSAAVIEKATWDKSEDSSELSKRTCCGSWKYEQPW